MLSGRLAANGVTFAVSAALLTSCVGGGDDPGQVIAEGCVKPEISVEPVSGMTEKNIVVAGTIKARGKPLPDQVLRFLVKESEDSKLLWSSGARTGKDGRVVIDMAWALGRGFMSARQGFDKGKIIQIDYTNPAELKQVNPPGWCSTRVTGPFEPAR